MDSNAPLWERQARQWELLESPLRPSAEDLVRVQQSIDAWAADHASPPTALILGVTPEIAEQGWPRAATVVGTDVSMPMILGIWPRPAGAPVHRCVVQANWLALPLARGVCDLMFSDCCFANVGFSEAAPLAASVRRALRDDGILTTRMFLRPDADEQPDDVWDDLLAGRVGSFAVFKLRLLMSLCDDHGDVRVADGWKYFHSRCTDTDDLAEHTGWSTELVRTIEAYRDQTAAYWFPTVTEFRTVVTQFLRERACTWPSYELGDRCPTFVFSR